MSNHSSNSKFQIALGLGWILPVLFVIAGMTLNAADQPRVSITPREPRAPAETAPRPNIRLDVQMVLVPVTVTDSTDHPVNGLPAEAFQVLEDNVEQKIVSFFKEDGPVSVGFIFDTSSSMKDRMDKSVAAIRQFMKTTVPGDEFFLIQFSSSPGLVTPFTTDPDEILKPLAQLHPQGWTSLYDAMYLGVHQMKSAKNPRRALFILSDGADNSSRYSESETRSLLMESDVRIFAIGLFAHPRFLEKIAAETGGKTYWVRKLAELPDVVDRLSREFRNQYVIGYSPNRSENDGKYRKVKVELAPSILSALIAPLRVAWRRGYYAPGN